MARTRHALIAAAGRGERFGQSTSLSPKPLIPVKGVPLILRVLLESREAGIDEFTIVTGYLGDILESFLRVNSPPAVSLRFVRNNEWQRPNGISVLKAKGVVPGKFFLLMSDHLFDKGILEELDYPLPDGRCRMAVDSDPGRVFDLDDAMKVNVENGIIKQIGKSIAGFNAIDTGIFLCTGAIFSAIEKAAAKGGESLSHAVQELARLDRMEACDIGGLFWLDIDDEHALARAESLLSPHCLRERM